MISCSAQGSLCLRRNYVSAAARPPPLLSVLNHHLSTIAEMRLSTIPILLAAAGTQVSSLAVPQTHVVHERRDNAGVESRWIKRDRVASHVKLPVRIGLKQSNMDKAFEWLMDVSHPASEKYGQHW